MSGIWCGCRSGWLIRGPRHCPRVRGSGRTFLRRFTGCCAASGAANRGFSATLQDFRQAGVAMPDGLVIVDGTNHIEWCNPKAELHFGLDPQRDAGSWSPIWYGQAAVRRRSGNCGLYRTADAAQRTAAAT